MLLRCAVKHTRLPFLKSIWPSDHILVFRRVERSVHCRSGYRIACYVGTGLPDGFDEVSCATIDVKRKCSKRKYCIQFIGDHEYESLEMTESALYNYTTNGELYVISTDGMNPDKW